MTTTRILQLTDLHLFADPDERLKGIPTRETLLSVLAHVQESGEQLDHVIVTGDHTHDELPETYRAVQSLLEPWSNRLWQVPGNHDDRAVMRSVFGDRIRGAAAERINFTFRAGAWLCLGLDTQLPGNVSGSIEADQIAWIEHQLEEHQPAYAALFMHHPPVLVGCAWLDRIGLEDRELLQDLVVREPRIRLACCGHVHHDTTHHLGRATIVTTPSTGLQFTPASDTVAFAAAPPGYRLIELSDEGCTTRVVRLPETRFSPTEEE